METTNYNTTVNKNDVNKTDLTDDLKDVIQRNVDAYKGYDKAADKVNNVELHKAFKRQGMQRKAFAMELESVARVFGAEGKDRIESGSFEGTLHRTWMDIKTAFSSDNDESIVSECIRGENEAAEEYNELLNNPHLTGELRTVISDQRDTVINCISDLKVLENTLSS